MSIKVKHSSAPLYARLLMMQSKAYFIDVSRVEDNLAHLLEHCIIHQIADLVAADGNQFFLGDCHGVVGPGALVFVVEYLNQPVIECVQSFLADKPEIPQGAVELSTLF